eukprot:6062547-Amphidinium_carterae.1
MVAAHETLHIRWTTLAENICEAILKDVSSHHFLLLVDSVLVLPSLGANGLSRRVNGTCCYVCLQFEGVQEVSPLVGSRHVAGVLQRAGHSGRWTAQHETLA